MDSDSGIRRGKEALARIHGIEAGCDPSHPLGYTEEWDTYFCRQCNVWLEPTCSDPDCDYCQHRPTRPVET